MSITVSYITQTNALLCYRKDPFIRVSFGVYGGFIYGIMPNSIGVSLLYEMRLHGRGGQGIVTAAELLVNAAFLDGKWGQATPYFGAERRGAAVVATVRVANAPIRVHGQASNPDGVVVFTPRLLETVDVTAGLKEGGLLILNAPRVPDSLAGKSYRLATVDATRIALENNLVISGFPFVNVSMVGAIVRATGLATLESALKATRETWTGDLGERNALAMRRAYEELVLDVVKVR